jgi:2-oxo-3-hexenedioate decarboxylase
MSSISPIEAQAQALLRAWDEARCVPLPSAVLDGGLDGATAYAIGQRLSALRIARGERPVGWKIGFTNRGLWERYGVDRPMWAPVYDTTLRLLDGAEATLSLAGLSQPRIEPEIVFGFARAPQAGMALDALQSCIAWVAHGFEIVHTHYDGWRFTAADTAADFALHGRLLVGPRVAVEGWPTLAADLAALRIELACDGTVKDRGAGTAVLDGPLQALKALVDSMAETTPAWRIAEGDVVTTGTLTDAWPLARGQQWRTTLSEPRLAGLSLRIE